MRFGRVATAEAEGAILAHAVRFGREILKKGRVLGIAEITALAAAGVEWLTVARLDPGDVEENMAASWVAQAAAGTGVAAEAPATGRVNLFAAQPGLLALDPTAVDALNRVTEDVTLATLPGLAPVAVGQMVATVKIIPFAVADHTLGRCVAAATAARIAVLPFRSLGARLIQTVNAGLKQSVIDKTSAVTLARLERIGGRLAGEVHCPHETAPLAAAIVQQLAAGPDLLLIIGASAIVDRRDVIPSAIEDAGGRIERLGMPVDPGNLILLGDIGGTPVLGLPGCARSPARNGLDWMLERLAAGIPADGDAVARMGVGGLLIGREEEKDYF